MEQSLAFKLMKVVYDAKQEAKDVQVGLENVQLQLDQLLLEFREVLNLLTDINLMKKGRKYEILQRQKTISARTRRKTTSLQQVQKPLFKTVR